MEDKLILDAVANDNDNNAVITKSDIMNDLRVNYDTNGKSCTTLSLQGMLWVHSCLGNDVRGYNH